MVIFKCYFSGELIKHKTTFIDAHALDLRTGSEFFLTVKNISLPSNINRPPVKSCYLLMPRPIATALLYSHILCDYLSYHQLKLTCIVKPFTIVLIVTTLDGTNIRYVVKQSLNYCTLHKCRLNIYLC